MIHLIYLKKGDQLLYRCGEVYTLKTVTVSTRRGKPKKKTEPFKEHATVWWDRVECEKCRTAMLTSQPPPKVPKGMT